MQPPGSTEDPSPEDADSLVTSPDGLWVLDPNKNEWIPHTPQKPDHRTRPSRRRRTFIASVGVVAVAIVATVAFTISEHHDGAGGSDPTTTGVDDNDPSYVCIVEVGDEIQLQNDSAFGGGQDIRGIVASTSQSDALTEALAALDLTADNGILDAAAVGCGHHDNPLLTSEEIQQLVQVADANSDTGVSNDLKSITRFG